MSYNNRQYQRTFLGNPSGIPTPGTSQIFSGAGTFHGVVVGTTAASAFCVFDTIGQTGIFVTNGSTAMILKTSVAEGVYLADMSIASGLYVSFAGTGTYTVLWSQGS